MNDKIKQLKNDYQILKENYNEKKSQMIELLLSEYEKYFESIGIVKGSKVIVMGYGDGSKGIFLHFKLRYGDIEPVIMKVKKDGTAHKTATVFCYKIENVRLLKEVT